MVSGYIKSQEGAQAYAAIGLTYPPTLQDEDYESWGGRIKDLVTFLTPVNEPVH
jgi:hypothetical protein